MRIADTICQQQTPWERVRAGIAAFLDGCAESTYQTIVLKEGPAAIGWERWRELYTDYYAHLVRAFIDILAPAGLDDYALAVVDRLLSSFPVTLSNRPTPEPIRIGIGQLRASTATYLDRVATGETIDVIRRGRVLARLQPWTS